MSELQIKNRRKLAKTCDYGENEAEIMARNEGHSAVGSAGSR